MKKFILTLMVLPSFMLLNACVHHFDQAECKLTDWRAMGEGDGAKGISARDLSTIITDCQKFNISVDTNAYSAGYKVGVAKFCKPSYDDGVNAGDSGQSKTAISGARGSFCSSHGKTLVLDDFNRGYDKGIKEYCTADRGHDDGVQGKVAAAACGSQTSYKQAWHKGIKRFCGNKATAFSYGKSAKDYPQACTPVDYPDFKHQYDRGKTIHDHIADLNKRIDDLNTQIDSQVKQYGLNGSGSSYSIGTQKTANAMVALTNVRSLVSQRDQLKNDVFQANMTE